MLHIVTGRSPEQTVPADQCAPDPPGASILGRQRCPAYRRWPKHPSGYPGWTQTLPGLQHRLQTKHFTSYVQKTWSVILVHSHLHYCRHALTSSIVTSVTHLEMKMPHLCWCMSDSLAVMLCMTHHYVNDSSTGMLWMTHQQWNCIWLTNSDVLNDSPTVMLWMTHWTVMVWMIHLRNVVNGTNSNEMSMTHMQWHERFTNNAVSDSPTVIWMTHQQSASHSSVAMLWKMHQQYCCE